MSQQAQEISVSNVVPESLLALAKDTRYVEECKILLLQVLRSVLPQRREDLLDRDAWYLSVVLYNFLVILRKGRTLGMEICGLRYPERIARWKVVAASLATASSIYALHRATTDGEDSSGPGTESLRGTQRRQVYDNQRQAMLRRANSTSDAVSSPMRNTGGQEQVSSAPSSIRGKMRELIRKLLQSVVTAVSNSSRMEGPHAPVETQQRTLTVGIWLLRLHLAYYCLTGRYPSLTHRLVGHTVEEDGSKRLVSRPNNFRVVGILILAQAAGTAIQTISQKLTHWWIDRSSLSTLAPPTPSIKFEGSTSLTSSSSSPPADPSGIACAICQQDRRHPACPTVCGHVFCWKCLQQWVSSKGECPLCRTTCRPQDILALHSYTPPTE
jgi:peroxin-10